MSEIRYLNSRTLYRHVELLVPIQTLLPLSSVHTHTVIFASLPSPPVGDQECWNPEIAELEVCILIRLHDRFSLRVWLMSCDPP